MLTLFPNRITIVTGHYGTGKTEFSVNLALALASHHPKVMLADLDIINPYFRSRERKEELERAGVSLISTSPACIHADVPSLPPQLMTVFSDRQIRGVLDIGGDPVGARVLSRFREIIRREDHGLIYLLNANRPEVRTPQQAADSLRAIEDVTGLTCSGIVNNTHLCGETTSADILRGAQLACETSALTQIPVLAHTAQRKLIPELGCLAQPLFPIEIYMKKPWEV